MTCDKSLIVFCLWMNIRNDKRALFCEVHAKSTASVTQYVGADRNAPRNARWNLPRVIMKDVSS
uniref:Hypothethical protein n=1 Tax=Ralstonia syzygii R24 TaxID=907261 RepID=G3A707_9RALS|nr:hypothethical protein [Ralstonia syzygii R24]